jgi:hypothetical protein
MWYQSRALNIFERKKAPGHQALNVFEQRLQGIKPSTLDEYAWTQQHMQLDNINLLYDSNTLDNILQLYNSYRHLQLNDINSQQQ